MHMHICVYVDNTSIIYFDRSINHGLLRKRMILKIGILL